MSRHLEALARKDHERGCRNEPPWPNLTISHRDVHDVVARRIAARERPSDTPKEPTR